MATDKKGITVKIDADLHAEIREYLNAHEMTMAEFISLAVEDELHPKHQEREEITMEKMRTLAFQVPEDLFQRIKDYLHRNNMTQKEFVIGLIENEIERDLTEREAQDNTEEEVGEEEIYGDENELDDEDPVDEEDLTEKEDDNTLDGEEDLTDENLEETDDTEFVDGEVEEEESDLAEDDSDEEEIDDLNEDFDNDDESDDFDEDAEQDEDEDSEMGMEMSM